ncbi:MAG: hypothetical protein ACXWTY_01850 [Methylobacter sp.]
MIAINIKSRIAEHLEKNDFDIRKRKDARFMDQKCTPDVLSAVAESILEFTGSDSNKIFTIRDIWESKFSNDFIVNSFQKPSVDRVGVQNEYDKFFSQPIKTFQYAMLLESAGRDGRGVCYKVAEADILEYIAVGDKKALDFLTMYLEKVLDDSELLHLFDKFFQAQTRHEFECLKDKYCDYIIEHTPINGKTEVSRIFTKVLNPLAFKNKSYGTRQGRMSPTKIMYAELFYNRINFRDIDKPKDQSRKEYLSQLGEQGEPEKYQVEKAKRQIKKYHSNNKSEVHRFMVEDANHVHHIFPQNEFPELSDSLENLILLTPTQHLNFAHRAGKTSVVDRGYQMICLISKLDSIEESEYFGKGFYSLDDFKRAVNTGLSKELLSHPMSFQDVKNALAIEYVY